MPRVGLGLSALETRPFDDLVRVALSAESSGVELLAVPEAWSREAFTILGFLAARTARIRLATGIVNVFSRTPALLAMAAATLDELSGGRAILGLGVSGGRVIEGFHGVAMERPLLRLREVTEAVRALVHRDREGYAGRLVRIDPGFTLRFAGPRQAIPIFHASLTPKAIVQCGEIADGWFPFLYGADELRRDMTLVEEGLARAGRARATFTAAPFVPTIVDDDLDAARRAVKRHIAFYVGAMGRFYHGALVRHGHGAAADAARAEWRAGRRDAATERIPDELVERLAACGSPERVRAHLDALRAAGADLPVAFLPLGATNDQAERTIRAIAA